MVDFDSRARQWDSNPVFLERALRVADGIRARVPLGPARIVLGCHQFTWTVVGTTRGVKS